MDLGTETVAEPEILSREHELSRIFELVDTADGTGSKVLVLTGEPGAGKSTLVDRAASYAASRGRLVLRVRGAEGERELGFAGIHQLLHPLLGGIGRLPAHQAEALRIAFGMAEAEPSKRLDPMLPRLGVLNLLSEAAAERPLLLVVDDAQWLDLGSLEVLAFVARRLEGEPAALLLAARDEAVPERFDRVFPHLTAGPLDRAASVLLLNAQPHPPRGRARSQILQQAAGNPLALIELARAFAKDPSRRDRGAIDSLPLTARLEQIFAAELPTLPGATRRALLLAAAAGTAQLADVLHTVPGMEGPEVWLPAERTGLVRVEGGEVRLRHPLVRSAIYQAATFAERRETHLVLAAAFTDEPDRRAWHLAAAALGPDAEVADALAESAERSRHRGGYAAAAAALERAAELTPDREQRARRLLAAAMSATHGGHPQWVNEITSRVATLTDDVRLLAEASILAGWSLAVTLRYDDSIAYLLPVAESMATVSPVLALDAAGTAATPAYRSGNPFHRTELLRITGLVEGEPYKVDRVWVLASCAPFTARDQAMELFGHVLEALPEGGLNETIVLGGAAWALDETDQAVRLLGRAMDHLRRAATAGANATVAFSLANSLFESGAWTAAQSTAEEAFWMATEAGADYMAVGSPLLQATLRAARGDHAGARARAGQAVRTVDLRKLPGLYVLHRRALAMAALAEGDHATAYEQFRRTFTRDFHPLPVHYHASLYCVADLAAAAVRAGQTDDARTVLRAAEGTLSGSRSVRLDAILHRARALLTDSDGAEAHFRAALADPATVQWPFEHALAQLDFGEWLRRHRRSAEARPLLGTALEFFERLDARPWIERASAELRAAGVAVTAVTAPDAAADLTPQELQIAQLAAEGLTNRDIGARLYLSPRTIGFHLHKIFPKLGVTARGQLRDVLDGV